MVRYCSVYGCLVNSKTHKNTHFFGYPNDEERCRNWIKAVSRIDLEDKSLTILHKRFYVCHHHFAASDRVNKHLKRTAIPTLLLPDKESTSGTSKYTETDVSLLCCLCHLHIPAKIQSISQSAHTSKHLSKDTPRNRKLHPQSENKKRRLLEVKTEYEKTAIESDLPPLLKKVMDTRNALKCNYNMYRCDEEYIKFALNIYFASPGAYRCFSETLCLPNKRILERHIEFGISTKFDEYVIKYLQSKSSNLSESEKHCIICADEIPLKRNLYYQIDRDKVVGFQEIDEKQEKKIATQAFVVMARGIFSNWKQPLALCFLSQRSKNYAELNKWLENIIAKMIEIGYKVCAFITDQGSNFINMDKNKSISSDQPYFFVNGRKIYYIFDVPHLIKSLRDNLIDHDFTYQEDDGSRQVASWNDIKNMHCIEKNKMNKIYIKLTESHINPNRLEKLRVKYATQVLSRSVAMTISNLVETGKLHVKCLGTTKFIALINDTFDILNSSTVNDEYKYKKAFNHADYQENTLRKAQRILCRLRLINRDGKDVTDTVKFIKGLLISIQAISSLAFDLKAAGYKYLFTRRLNQDPLENLFRKVRQQVGNCRKPTAIQFLRAFKELFMINITTFSDSAICARPDLHYLLMTIEETQNSLKPKENISIESSDNFLRVGTIDYRFELPEENAFTYVCGYLLRKCYDHHNDCEIMKNYFKTNEPLQENNLFGALINPPEDFKQYIKQLDSICEDCFLNCDFYRIGSQIIASISTTSFNLPCKCFPLEFLHKLFVRFRIYNVIRHNNKNFRNKSFKRKHFSISHL